jgi:hypothetical protein
LNLEIELIEFDRSKMQLPARSERCAKISRFQRSNSHREPGQSEETGFKDEQRDDAARAGAECAQDGYLPAARLE